MANTIIPKKSSVASAVPTPAQLAVGEIAFNLADRKIYSKNAGGTVIEMDGGLVALTSGVTGTLPIANGGTGQTTGQAALTAMAGYATTATANGTTTLTNTSGLVQQFTGTSNQTVVLPVTSTLALGWSFHIVNNSTGTLTLNSSGGNLVLTVPPAMTVMATCILTTGTTAASWEAGYTDFGSITGTGAVVLETSPTLNSPSLGTPTDITLTNGTGLPIVAGTTGTLSVARGGTGGTTKDAARQGIGITVSTTAPASPTLNDIWVDTN